MARPLPSQDVLPHRRQLQRRGRLRRRPAGRGLCACGPSPGSAAADGGAEGAVRFARESIRKARPLATHLDVRIDAGLVEGLVLDAIDDEGARFIGRIKNNARLDKLAAPYLSRLPGRPSKDGDEFAIDLGQYRAASWTRSYRLVLVVVDLPDPKTGMRSAAADSRITSSW